MSGKQPSVNITYDPESLLPGQSVDCVVFGYNKTGLHILILKWRGMDLWALPGGFIFLDESMDHAATRILEERTGINIPFLQQFHTFGAADRRRISPGISEMAHQLRLSEQFVSFLEQRFVSTGYVALVEMERTTPSPDPLSELCEWRPVHALPELLFDHQDIVLKALEHIHAQAKYLPIGINLLPDKFTMKELQLLYEAILQKPLDRANFQKKMLKLGILKRLEKQLTGRAHKAPYLYSFDQDRYRELLDQGIGLF